MEMNNIMPHFIKIFIMLIKACRMRLIFSTDWDYNNLNIPDFDHFEKESTKIKQWRFLRVESDWTELRIKYTSQRHIVESHTELPLFNCPDLCIGPEDNAIQIRLYDEVNTIEMHQNQIFIFSSLN